MNLKENGPALQYDFIGLSNFVRFMDTSGDMVVKVGIFGNKNARGATINKEAGKNGLRRVNRKVAAPLTNAELGLIHELGSVERNIPRRSFLRMPISVKSKEILADAMKGALQLMAEGNIRQILARLGIACEKWIQIAFGTRGFGSWAPDRLATAIRKGSGEPLIDTAQLRRSIASQVDHR